MSCVHYPNSNPVICRFCDAEVIEEYNLAVDLARKLEVVSLGNELYTALLKSIIQELHAGKVESAKYLIILAWNDLKDYSRIIDIIIESRFDPLTRGIEYKVIKK